MDETYQKIELNSNQAKQKRAIKKILKKFYDDNIKPLQDIKDHYWVNRDTVVLSGICNSVAHFDKVTFLDEVENKIDLLIKRLDCLPYRHGLTHKDVYKMIVNSEELQSCVELYGVMAWTVKRFDGNVQYGCENFKRKYSICHFIEIWKETDKEFFLDHWQCVLRFFADKVPGDLKTH